MKLDPQLLEFAKAMRSNATNAEHLMWQVLRAKRFMNLKFRRQHVIVPYIVDFYCHELGLVIELDGSQHGTDDAIAYDAERTKFLEALDLSVVRYWNYDVLSRTDMVLEDLWQKCSQLKMNKNESSYSLCERVEVKVSSNNSSKQKSIG